MMANAPASRSSTGPGPLEAAIVHIQKDIAAKQAESAELQRTWIKGQTELVTLQNQNAGVAEVLADRKAKLILEQKRMRCVHRPPLSPTIPLLPSHPAPISQDGRTARVARQGATRLRRASVHMHLEMGKINRLVNEHAEKQQVVAVQ